MSDEERAAPNTLSAIEDLTYDAQDALFDGDFSQARALATQAIECAVSAARNGSTAALSGSGPDSIPHSAPALPARIASATVGAFDVLLNVALQREEWAAALSSARQWVELAGDAATVRPFAAGLRAAFCGFCEAERAATSAKPGCDVDAETLAPFVEGSVALSAMLFDRSRQTSLAGGQEGLSAGQLILEQAQALAQICDLAVRSESNRFLDHATILDDALQEFMEAETSGLDALEPHEQGRVAALVAWSRCRTYSDSRRSDAIYALDMIADGSVEDALTSAEAARSARALATSKTKVATNLTTDDASVVSEPSLTTTPEGTSDFASLGLGLEGVDLGADMNNILAPTFNLATDYVPSPLDLGLGFMYALLALGSLESVDAESSPPDHTAAIAALDKAYERNLAEDENIQGVLILLHQALMSDGFQRENEEEASVDRIWARLKELKEDANLLSSIRASALRSSNVMVQQRLLRLL